MFFTRTMLSMIFAGTLIFSPGAALAEIKVVVTSKPIHALVSSVMAGIGTPDLLVEGQASPHTYAMKPSDARKVSKAKLFIRVSEELEPFTGKLVASLPKSVRVVSLAEAPGLKLLDRREGGAFDADHGHSHGKHDHSPKYTHGYDPHIWLNPDNAQAIVNHIADILAGLIPAKADMIKANTAAEIEKIAALSRDIARDLDPVSGKPFIVYHDAYQYFEERFGLAAVGTVTVNPDLPPSGRRLRQLREKIASVGAVCVFAEPQLNPRVTEALVEGTDVRVGTLDPEGITLTPGPDLYHVLMRNLARSFKACLAAQ